MWKHCGYFTFIGQTKVQQKPAAVNFHFRTGREVPSNNRAYPQAEFFLMYGFDSDMVVFYFSGLSSRLLSQPQLNLKEMKRFNDWNPQNFLSTESLCSWNCFSWFLNIQVSGYAKWATEFQGSLRILLQVLWDT